MKRELSSKTTGSKFVLDLPFPNDSTRVYPFVGVFQLSNMSPHRVRDENYPDVCMFASIDPRFFLGRAVVTKRGKRRATDKSKN